MPQKDNYDWGGDPLPPCKSTVAPKVAIQENKFEQTTLAFVFLVRISHMIGHL